MKKTGFLFEGQGAVKPLMGLQDYKKSSTFKKYFDFYSAALNEDVSSFLWGNKRKDLTKNIYYTHCAIFTTALAYYDTLLEKGFIPDIHIGHSLGELIALIAAKAITIEEGAELIKVRGSLFQQWSQTAPHSDMVAIIGEPDEILDFCLSCENVFDHTYIANYNTPKQIILSAQLTSIPLILDKARDKNIRCKQLNIGIGCHSKFVEPFEQEFINHINSLDFKTPEIPVYSSSFNCFYTDKKSIMTHLPFHLKAPVRWSQSISDLIKNESEHWQFIEVGCFNTLKGFLLHIDKSLHTQLTPSLIHKINSTTRETYENTSR